MKITALLAVLFVMSTSCSTTHPPKPSSVSKTAWAEVLAKYVNKSGQIDFRSLRAEPAALQAAAYQVVNEPAIPSLTSPERLAFLLNGYNTLAMYHATVSGVEPEQLVRFFLLSKYLIEGKLRSLYTLENQVIRPLGEPRIHFALNCMVRSCPRLRQEPFSALRLDLQLEEATVEFLNDPRHVRVEAETKTVYLSKILKWYRKDFENEETTLLEYINGYRAQPVPEDFRIVWLPYDWSLNQL